MSIYSVIKQVCQFPAVCAQVSILVIAGGEFAKKDIAKTRRLVNFYIGEVILLNGIFLLLVIVFRYEICNLITN